MFNKLPDLLGFHVEAKSSELLEKVKGIAAEYTRTMQFYLTPPQKWEWPAGKRLTDLLALQQSLKLRLIFHSPYIVTLVRDKPKLSFYATEYPVKLFAHLKEVGVKEPIVYVLHTGKPDRNNPFDAEIFLKKNIGKLLSRLDQFKLDNACIAIENDANGYCKATQLESLYQSVAYYGDPRVKVCFDTEHCYASGRDPKWVSILEEVWRWIAVVHLNGIPKEVEQGSGLDRHGETRLADSKSLEFVEPLVRHCVRLGLPMILERSNLQVIQDDIEFVSSISCV